MKKNLLLILAVAICCFNLYGQEHCTTCHQGQRYPDSMHLATLATKEMLSPNRIGNGNSSLGQSYVVQNVCGLNYVQGSVLTETRSIPFAFNANGTGFPTTDTISGLPACSTILKAYLYWEASYTEPTPPATSATVTNPALVTNPYAGTLIGQAGPKCWGEVGSATYRTDVTAAISGNGVYTINLTGFANAAWEVDGCTMVVVYTGNGAFSGSLSLWDGDIVNWYVLPAQTFSGINVCASSPNANAFGVYGDIQINVNGGINTNTYNGSTATFPNDFWNFNDIPTSVTTGQTTTVDASYTNNTGDCYAWILAGLYWQNTTCVTCAGSSVTLAVDSTNPTCGNNNGTAGVVATGGSFPYTYLWQPGGQTNATATGLSIGVYTVEVISGCDTSFATDTLIGVSLLLVPNHGNVLCNGGNTGFAAIHASGGTGPYTYSWSPVVSTMDSVSNLTAGSYTVTVTDNNGCHTNDTITITQPPLLTLSTTPTGTSCNGGTNGSAYGTGGGGTPGYTYLWSNAATTDTAKNLSAGTYTLTITDANGCTATATAIVTEPTTFLVTASGPQTICLGSSGTLTATATGGTQPYTYLWSTGSSTSTASITPTSTATYTVVVTDANGCTASGTVLVTLGSPITLAITGDHSICQGGTVTLCATASGGTGGDVFSWEPGNFSGPCITVSPTSTTIYTATVTDNCGSIVSTLVTVPVNPSPEPAFSADVYQGCSPLCIQFRDKSTLSSGRIASWTWIFGDGDTSDRENPIYCYPNPGSYNVTLTAVSDSGCSATLNIVNLITVYSHPNAQFTESPQPTDILSPTIQFTDKSSDAYGVAYWWWNFGDGTDSISNLENPSHTYQDTGTFCAQLVAMNNHGCLDTVTNCLIIEPIYTLYIPSAFTPNNDGKNEMFMAKGNDVKTFEMYIFDRWGMQLFHSSDINVGWNGTVNNGTTVAQEDTYVYMINATDNKNKKHSYVGQVTLLK